MKFKYMNIEASRTGEGSVLFVEGKRKEGRKEGKERGRKRGQRGRK